MNADLAIADNHVVEIEYKLTNGTGELLDSSDQLGPMPYIHGKSNILPALEKELTGKIIGDSLEVSIAAADGYGERDENMVQAVPRDQFPDAEQVEVGMQFQVQTPDGHPMIVTVSQISDDTIEIDGNHPLAGVDLKFDVKIVSIRDATAEELAHGHLHRDGGTCEN